MSTATRATREIEDLVAGQGAEVLQSLVLCLRTARYYSVDHSALGPPIERLTGALATFERAGIGDVALVGVGYAFFLNGQLIPLRGPHLLLAGALRDMLGRIDAGGVRFQGVPAPASIRAFIERFWKLEGGAATDLWTAPPAGIALEKRRYTRAVVTEDVDRQETALGSYAQLLSDTQAWAAGGVSGQTPETRRLKRGVADLVDSMRADPDRVLGLLSLRMFKGERFNHQVNTSVLSLRLGHAVGYEAAPLAEVGMVSLVHDFGGQTPAVLSCAPGSSSALARAQPALGLRASYETRRLAAVVAYEKGMPLRGDGADGYAQAKPPFSTSRIATITDAFDVATTASKERAALPPDVALRTMMADIGRRFDPLLLKLFVNVLGLFPVGTPVRLTDGRNAVVVGSPAGAPAARPRVRIVDGRAEGNVIDLGHATHRSIGIAHALDPDEIDINVTQLFTI